MATDRRRINAPPPGGTSSTSAPVYCRILQTGEDVPTEKWVRQRDSDQPRKIFIQTNTIPTANGSAYLELAPSHHPSPSTPISPAGSNARIPHPQATLKLSSTVHLSPLAHSRNTPFSPNAVLTTSVKVSPFATPSRRSRTAASGLERELGARLETALSGVILGERWCKMNVVVGVLVLETDSLDLDSFMADSDGPNTSINAAAAGLARGAALSNWRERPGLVTKLNSERGDGAEATDLSISDVTVRADSLAVLSSTVDWAIMSILSGCITVASAALTSAGVDCVDLPAGGVAAIVQDRAPTSSNSTSPPSYTIVLDPHPAEHELIHSACMVSYLPGRDELTDCWIRGDPSSLIAGANGSSSATVRLPAGLLATNTNNGSGDNDTVMDVDADTEAKVSIGALTTNPLDDLLNAACATALGVRSVLQEAIEVGLGGAREDVLA